MPIFNTNTASINLLQITGSSIMSGSSNVLTVLGSGSTIFTISGSDGAIFSVNDDSTSSTLFSVTSASINILNVNNSKNVSISGSLIVTGSITGSLLGTASFATSASYALSSSFSTTASFALNAGGGSGFPFSGSALITGSIILTSGSGFPSLAAGENLAAGDFVNIYSGGVRKASNNDTTKQAHGFVLDAFTTGNNVVVYYSGLNTTITGLTAGARYFLGTAGGETTTPPTAAGQLSQEIGVAISTTAILVDFSPAIIT
jgi:hypothetical protein